MKVMVEKSVVESPRGDGTSPRVTYRGVRGSARGGFWALSAEKSTFLRLFWRKCKNPLPRDLNPRPPLLLHRGVPVRPDPQVFTRAEFPDRQGPESFQIWALGCVLSPVIALHGEHRSLGRLSAGVRDSGRGGARVDFFGKFPFFAENVQQSGFETGTVEKMGVHLPLG